MPKITKIVCDNCGKDLATTGAMPRFRLFLGSEAVPHNSSTTHAVRVYPEIKAGCYFCDLLCLKGWLVSMTHLSKTEKEKK